MGQVIKAYSCWWRLPALVAFICYIHTCFFPFKNFDSLMFIQLFKKAQISIWVCRKSVCMVYSIINHEVLFQCFLLFRFFWQVKQLAAIREATEARVVLVLFFLFIKNIVCDLVEKKVYGLKYDCMIHLSWKPKFCDQHHHKYIKSRFYLPVVDSYLLHLASPILIWNLPFKSKNKKTIHVHVHPSKKPQG